MLTPTARMLRVLRTEHGARALVLFIACVCSPGLLASHAIAETDGPHLLIAQASASKGDAASEEDVDEPTEGSSGVAPPAGVEVIRVKGRALAAIETDVPDSVTQFDAATIEALGAQNIGDLADVTPNVEIRTAGATAATFFIRGVGLSDFSANAAGAVAIYQDDVSLNAPALQLGQLFDIENVEILRGPQGGGSGRNASAGAIKAYGRKPSGTYEAQLRASFGTYLSPDADEALIQDYEGALEIPIVEDILATRLSFRFRDAEPFMRNGCGDAPPFDQRLPVGGGVSPGEASICGEQLIRRRQVSPIPVGLPTRVGDQGNWAARGFLRFQPPENDFDMDWLIKVSGSKLDQQSTLGQAIGINNQVRPVFGGPTASGYIEPDQLRELCELQGLQPDFDAIACTVPGGIPRRPVAATDESKQALAENLAENRPLDEAPYRGDYDRVGQTKLNTWGGFLRGDMSFGSVNFTTISAYDGYNRSRDTDQDFTPDVLFEGAQEDKAWQFSQELRFFGELEEQPLTWELGGYYLMEDLESSVAQDFNAFGRADQFTREYEQQLYSFGIYGSLSWNFLDDFTLDAGLRYNWEHKDFRISQDAPNFNESSDAKTWAAPTGSISLTYHIGEESTAYFKYSRGFKAGHFNSNGVESPEAKPEFLDSFEAGLRGRWWDGRFSLGGAFFYYIYQDYQVFVFEQNPNATPTLQIINANDAEVYGTELDFRIEPLAGFLPGAFDGLVLTGRFGWLESQFIDFTNEIFRQKGIEFVPVIEDFSGNPLISSPRFTLSGAVEWTFELGRWGSLVPRYDFAWTDDVFFDPTAGVGIKSVDGNLFLPEYAVGQRKYWLHNLRLAYVAPAGNMELAVWVRNLADQRYKSYAFDATSFAKLTINFVGPPRTIGMDLSISW